MLISLIFSRKFGKPYNPRHSKGGNECLALAVTGDFANSFKKM